MMECKECCDETENCCEFCDQPVCDFDAELTDDGKLICIKCKDSRE